MAGIRTLQRLVADARSARLLTVLDVKRGDVGTTNDAYAEAFLGTDAPLEADAITVHPYLGLAAMGGFVTRAHEAGPASSWSHAPILQPVSRVER